MSKNGNESDAKVNFAPASGGLRPPDPLLFCFKTVPPHSFASSYAYALGSGNFDDGPILKSYRLYVLCLVLAV